MNKTSIVVGALTLVATAAIASVATLAVTSKTNTDSDIITMKGETVTVSEYFEFVKTNPSAQQAMLNLVIQEVFESGYGKKVTEEDVQKAYDEEAKNYGENFSSALTQAGFNNDTYRRHLRTNALVEYAVAEEAKKELTDENYKAAYETYTPEVTAQIIKLDDEAAAKDILEKAKAEGADFAQLAKDNSKDEATKADGGTIKFDSTSTTVPADVQKAIFALADNQVAEEFVTVIDPQTFTTSYYVVKLNSKSEKSANWADHKEVLEKAILAQKEADPNFINSVVAKQLQNANVKVKDQAFQAVLTQYMSPESSAPASSEASEAPASSDK